ncbi:MAG: hypothetical protein K2N56_11890 [Oscillospiraceae bacterium]|nr:hypothetical protein [Oscillospiraceae bacterium]
MKKIVSILCTAALIASLTGCNNGTEKSNVFDDSPVSDSSDNIGDPGVFNNSDSSESSDGQSGAFKPWEPVDIASLPVKHVDWGDIFDDPVRGAFQITDKLGENYYGSRSTLNAVIESEEVLMSADKKEFRSLKYPENFPDWRYGSGAYVTLDNRYYYNWLSYTSQFSPDSLHDVKLTRVDGNTGEVTVVDEVKSVLPFIYLVKIDEGSFLSYSVMPDTSDLGTLTNASIYYSDGTKKDIISEKYQNEADWTDSIGTLIENFAVKDGEIYGFGRRRISGEYKFFLYHYNKDGELLDTAELPGMESIMGDRQAMEFRLVGDYLIFRSYEDLKRYICRITDIGV